MELLFLALLILLMALALGSGFPVAFALPGAAVVSILAAAICGYLFAGDVNAYFAQGGPGQWLSAGVTNLRGVYWEPERDTLIAIPLFIFMGIMLQRSKIAEDLLITMAQLFGPIRGGLGISVVFVGALLAATTGIVGATVVAMGLISLPAMLRNNYSKQLATGTIAASGTLGQLIPPSIVLIILADQLGSAADQAGTTRKTLYRYATGELSMPTSFDVGSTSAGEMFLGAFVPGLVLVAIYMVFIFLLALIRPASAPAVHHGGKYDRAFAIRAVVTLVPPLALILLVLGSIIAGVATVNQAGAIGAAGALIMAGYKLMEGRKRAYWPAILALASVFALWLILGSFNVNVKSINSGRDVLGIVLASVAVIALSAALAWSGWRALRIEDTMRGVVIETAKTTSLVFIILLGAAMLTAAFRSFGGEELVREFLNGLPGGFWTQFVIVMAVIFLLGFFLDFIEIAVVVVPIVAPILLADPSANITAVWLGVMIGINMQTSFLTPPFGFALFYLRGVAPPSVKTLDIYKGVVPFIVLQLMALVVVGLSPPLVNYLPNRLALLSETAPPPRNPRLQYCIERYVFVQLEQHGEPVRGAIADLRKFDFSALPEDIAKSADQALDRIEQSFELIAKLHEAERSVLAATPDYRPFRDSVRALESDALKIEQETALLRTRLERIRGQDEEDEERRQGFRERIAEGDAEKKALLDRIPSEWDDRHSAFAALQKAEDTARNTYQRTADGAYEGITSMIRIVESSPALTEAAAEIENLPAAVAGKAPAEAAEAIKAVEDRIADLEGASELKSALSRARRALTARTPDPAQAAENLAAAAAAVGPQLQWRQAAEGELLAGLRRLEELTRLTIGLRQQPKLPREQALEIAACNSSHRDISLNF